MATLDLHCEDTIAALLTGSGDGVVAVVRVSGPQALAVRDVLFTKAAPGPHRAATLHRGLLQLDAGEPMEALCATFPGQKSYTGEPCVEVHGYGGRINSARLLACVLRAGARQAMPGEFSLRAYLHGKMDLDQAEAVAALLGAQSAQAAQAALRLRAGALGKALEPLRAQMLTLLAETEAYLDFPEDGLPAHRVEAHRTLAHEAAAALRALLHGQERTQRLLHGARVVLWGEPNAGKSSLLNALLGEDRSIVDAAPGTTRDVVEAHVVWDGFPVTLLDTAGVRDTAHAVELQGVQRSQAQAAQADLVLCCVPADQSAGAVWNWPVSRHPPLVVATKADLGPPSAGVLHAAATLGTTCVAVSALRGDGLEELRRTVMVRLAGEGTGVGDCVTANARQGELLERAACSLLDAVRLRAEGQPEEAVAECWRGAARYVGEVSGRAIPTEEVLGAIFSTFCIGK